MATEPTPPVVNSATASVPVKLSDHPWITWLAVMACIVVHTGLQVEGNSTSWESLSKWGYLPATVIWEGSYWALFSSVFVHLAFWHLLFNVYWLWVLGSRLEKTIGSLPFLAFFVASALVSSSFQLGVSDDTGLGASGVVYAMFGFMWPLRHRFPDFKEVLDQKIVLLFIAWLIGCVAVTYLKIWEVGNVAHVSGMVFGALLAGYFVAHYKPALTFAGIFIALVLSIVPLIWCPWSVTWWSTKAFAAHERQQYRQALDLYTRILQMDPKNAWAYFTRSGVHQALGEFQEADADREMARKLNPNIETTR